MEFRPEYLGELDHEVKIMVPLGMVFITRRLPPTFLLHGKNQNRVELYSPTKIRSTGEKSLWFIEILLKWYVHTVCRAFTPVERLNGAFFFEAWK